MRWSWLCRSIQLCVETSQLVICRRSNQDYISTKYNMQETVNNQQTNTEFKSFSSVSNILPLNIHLWHNRLNCSPLTLTTYSTDNTPLTIHSTDNTLNWQHTPLTTHSTDKTLYWRHALLLTALSPELANSTPSRTRQQHLHPSHNSQSPLSYVHSYPRQPASYISLHYTYFAP